MCALNTRCLLKGGKEGGKVLVTVTGEKHLCFICQLPAVSVTGKNVFVFLLVILVGPMVHFLNLVLNFVKFA